MHCSGLEYSHSFSRYIVRNSVVSRRIELTDGTREWGELEVDWECPRRAPKKAFEARCPLSTWDDLIVDEFLRCSLGQYIHSTRSYIENFSTLILAVINRRHCVPRKSHWVPFENRAEINLINNACRHPIGIIVQRLVGWSEPDHIIYGRPRQQHHGARGSNRRL